MSSSEAELIQRRDTAAAAFNRQENRGDGAAIVDSLSFALTILRDSLFTRMHDDVQRRIGMDSMLMPVSLERAERAAELEIELYLVAVSAEAATRHRYVSSVEWYLDWLKQLRVGGADASGKMARRLASYLGHTPDGRRLAFGDVLAAALAESRRAPLVLHRLLPLAVEIATANAFGDEDTVLACREAQVSELPAIRDCHRCEGGVLENSQQCPDCGNPLWKFDLLTRD